MPIPLGERTARGSDEPGVGGCGFERLAFPVVERALYRRTIVGAAQQPQHAAVMMRQAGMEPHPTAVAAAIEAAQPVGIVSRIFPLDAQIPLAAKFDRGVAHVDADALPPSRAQPPKPCSGERRSRNRRLRRGADRERRGKRRLGAGERNVAEHRLVEASETQQRDEHHLRIRSRHVSICPMTRNRRH